MDQHIADLHAERAAAIADELARNLRSRSDPRFGSRILEEAQSVSVPAIQRELAAAAGDAPPGGQQQSSNQRSSSPEQDGPTSDTPALDSVPQDPQPPRHLATAVRVLESCDGDLEQALSFAIFRHSILAVLADRWPTNVDTWSQTATETQA